MSWHESPSPACPPLGSRANCEAAGTLPNFPPTPELSRREREILSLIAEGFTNDMIARRLGIALSTVKNHTTNIFRKLDVPNRTNAAIYVWRSAYAKTGEHR